jgi:hypothetical protein
MTQRGIGAAGEDGSHPSALATNLRSSDCVNPTCNEVQAAGSESMLNCAPGETKRQELLARHHAVLGSNEPPSRASSLRI